MYVAIYIKLTVNLSKFCESEWFVFKTFRNLLIFCTIATVIKSFILELDHFNFFNVSNINTALITKWRYV